MIIILLNQIIIFSVVKLIQIIIIIVFIFMDKIGTTYIMFTYSKKIEKQNISTLTINLNLYFIQLIKD